MASSEDVKGEEMKDFKVGSHPDVDRVKRAHMNDLENIPLFILIAAVFLTIVQPAAFTAKLLCYGFTAARYIHTFVYLNEVRQPARALSFMIGLVITMFMCGHTIIVLF